MVFPFSSVKVKFSSLIAFARFPRFRDWYTSSMWYFVAYIAVSRFIKALSYDDSPARRHRVGRSQRRHASLRSPYLALLHEYARLKQDLGSK